MHVHIVSVYIATHCNTLQQIATHCNTLQHTSIHCNTLPHGEHSLDVRLTRLDVHVKQSVITTATCCNTLQHAATRSRAIQHSLDVCLIRQDMHVYSQCSHCNTLQHTATHCNTLQHTTMRYNKLPRNQAISGRARYACLRRQQVLQSVAAC